MKLPLTVGKMSYIDNFIQFHLTRRNTKDKDNRYGIISYLFHHLRPLQHLEGDITSLVLVFLMVYVGI
jgi:hypothetical protein